MEMNELIQNGLENSKRVIDRTLDGLTPAELKWQPRPDANSIGLILFHCIRSEDRLFTYCKVNHSSGNRRSCTRNLTKQLKMVEPITRRNRLLPSLFLT